MLVVIVGVPLVTMD